ncbi:hypothetical protein [Ruegeria arenilitoris]|nr:hypothetical protein [Ruegeria arenilitoris]
MIRMLVRGHTVTYGEIVYIGYADPSHLLAIHASGTRWYDAAEHMGHYGS